MNAPRIIADGIDPESIAAVLRLRQHAVLGAGIAADRPTESLLAFDLGGVRHGVPIGMVRAVATMPKVARLPHAPSALTGLVAWRGSVVNLFAPGAVLGRDADATTATAMIVLRNDTPRIALAVDALSGVVTVPRDDATPALARLVIADDSDGERLTRVDPTLLIELLLPSRPQEG